MTNILTGILTLIGIMGLVALIIGLPLMLLWNWLMPTLFGLPFITFWQAVGLNFLSTILFGKYTNTFNKKS
jgi:hypothetical protein